MPELSEHSASLKPNRLGLALSGGGFRASFFHIGVLAKLAELGLLKHVEVISTVSGGAIIGALYYLHLKKLLENKLDTQISDDDYTEIIKKIIQDFLKAVQKNIIMTAYSNPFKTIKMASDGYSSSIRLAELYEEYFYKPVFGADSSEPIKMSDLKISPCGEDSNFYPLRDNKNRLNKIPVLLINSACLNTGRNWYFEATHMGEAPKESPSLQEIDKNLRLVRPESYEILSKEHKDFLLSHAVAASASLPAVFAPIKISNLYPNEITLQLSDAGVRDNQGTDALTSFECKEFIISDASRPLEFETKPDTKNEGLLLRVRSILADRMREEQLCRMLEGTYKDHTAFIHLRKTFPLIKQNYLSSSYNSFANNELKPLHLINDFSLPTNSTDINPEVQQLLARVRTHLDSFTDLEAYSLMFYGYQVSNIGLAESNYFQDFTKHQIRFIKWDFLRIAPLAKQPTPDYLKQLQVSSERFLKVFRLNPIIKKVSLLTALLILLSIVWVTYTIISMLWNITQVQEMLCVPLNEVISVFAPLFVLLFLMRVIFANRYASFREKWFSFWSKALLPALCFPLVWLHLFFYDQIFLKIGQITLSEDFPNKLDLLEISKDEDQKTSN